MIADQLAVAIADRLAHPDTVHVPRARTSLWQQSLAYGMPGIALLHIELAAAGRRSWQRAHDWLAAITHRPVTGGADSHAFYGTPALAHALACAATARPGSYQRALDRLSERITVDVRRRLAAAHARIDAGRFVAPAEFDTIQGLTGLGALLLRLCPHNSTVRDVLAYLVRLTEPLRVSGESLPGWWTGSSPSGHPDHRFPDGHANFGVSHGIGGPLCLLALAARRGVTVDRHREAMQGICAWLDIWRTETNTGPIWPYWVTRNEVRTVRIDRTGLRRPSWCYGTAGLARAQQLTALATTDGERRRMAESALIGSLSDPAQLATITDASLCHGYAGLAHIAARAAADAEPVAANRLRALIPVLLHRSCSTDAAVEHQAVGLLDRSGPEFLEGAPGIALAVRAAASPAGPATGWDTCLLIT